MKKSFFSIILFLSMTVVQAQDLHLSSYSFEKVDSLMNEEVRDIAVFLTADWCNFCKNMEINTLANTEVVQQLNESFYFVNFNGESRETVNYQNQTFKFKPTSRSSGTHELAEALGTIKGELTYPTFVILNPVNEIVFQYSGFLNKDELLSVLSKGE